MSAVALFATPPTRGRPHRLQQCKVVAALCGLQLLSWQLQVLRVATELDVDGSPFWRFVTVSVPRQNGKTVVGMVLAVERMLLWPRLPQRVVWVAQTLTDAVRVWRGGLWSFLEYELQGAEGLRFKSSLSAAGIDARNGSSLSIMSTSRSAGHGSTVGLAVCDEVHAYTDERVEAALEPAQLAVPDPQMVFLSVAGNEGSWFWRSKVELGRELVRSGGCERARWAHFEWGAPEGANPGDPGVWAKAVPALGETIKVSALERLWGKAEREEQVRAGAVSLFRQHYLNEWVVSPVGAVVEPGVWEGVCGVVSPGRRGLVLGVAASADRGVAAVAASDGGVVELVDLRGGVGWVEERLRVLCSRHDVVQVVCARGVRWGCRWLVSGRVGGVRWCCFLRGCRRKRAAGFTTMWWRVSCGCGSRWS